MSSRTLLLFTLFQPVDYSSDEETVSTLTIIYYFFLSKFTDMFDSVFFLARKKFGLLHIPGPTPLPILGNALLLAGPMENVLTTALSLREKYGNAFLFHFGMMPQLVISAPQDFEKILSNSVDLNKGFQYGLASPWLGDSLGMTSSKKWHSRRKLLNPAFYFQLLEDFLFVMNDQAEILTEKIEHVSISGEPVDFFPLMCRCALDVVCETAMGKGIGAQTNNESSYVKAMENAGAILFYRAVSPWLHNDTLFALSPSGRDMRRNLEIINGFTNNAIAERKKQFAGRLSDIPQVDEVGRKRRVAFLDLLVEASQDGTVLSDTDIRDEVNNTVFAGHDTVAFNTSITLYLFATHPQYQKKVQEELQEIFGDSDRPPTSADLGRMVFLTMIIKESLRLYPSIPQISRKLTQDLKLGGHHIPAQTEILLFIYLLHRDPVSFPDPDKFDPERFSPEKVKERHPYSYAPFSAGPRNCIGQKFAMMEEKVVLSTVLRRFDVEAKVPADQLLYLPELSMKPKNGLYISFKKREK